MAGGEAFWQPLDNPVTADDVKDLGRWEVVVNGTPPEAVANEANDDWLYHWTGA